MTEAHIYIDTKPRSPVKGAKKYAYILTAEIAGREQGTVPVTGEATATWHGATLTALADALGRFTRPCRIHIHTDNTCIRNCIAYRLEGWAQNNFLSAKGAEIANGGLWRKVWKAYTRRPGTVLIPEEGGHKYAEELKEALEGKDAAGI